jgi:hypothetical protein
MSKIFFVAESGSYTVTYLFKRYLKMYIYLLKTLAL